MFALWKRGNAAVFVTLAKRSLSVPARIPGRGLVKLDSSRFLRVSGPDASVFINGLTTVKMLPKHLKKNQTTISAADINNEAVARSIDLSQELITSSNWGILHEAEEYDPEDPAELPMRLGIRRDGRYGMILRANGRVFSDIFIYPTPFVLDGDAAREPTYLIELLNAAQFKPLQLMLKLHKLRAKVDIQEAMLASWFYYDDSPDGHKLYDTLLDVYFSNSASKDPAAANQLAARLLSDGGLISPRLPRKDVLGFAVDQRSDYFGLRIVSPEEQPPIDNVDLLPVETYVARRVQHGIVENTDFQSTATLPFECNLDWMRGINYDKGCYMGQELTIRTWTGNGTVRRVLPVVFDEKIPDLDDAHAKLELRVVEDSAEAQQEQKEEKEPVYNPFGSPASSSAGARPVRARRDAGKVGEVLVNDGERGLARVEKRYFDWDQELTKKVSIVHNGHTYAGTIDAGIWNE